MSDGGAGSGVKEGFIHTDFNIEDSQTSLNSKGPEPVGRLGDRLSHRREWLESSQDWPGKQQKGRGKLGTWVKAVTQ